MNLHQQHMPDFKNYVLLKPHTAEQVYIHIRK
jgi:hypothetical protein